MNRVLFAALTVGFALSWSLAVTSNCVAQNVVKDYLHSRPFHYQPSDPWTRGRVYQQDTGNWGKYYNCDGEECKRYSPYIYWKVQPNRCHDKCPILCEINRQIARVKQRVRWGAGACARDGSCHPSRNESTESVDYTDDSSLAPQQESIPQSADENVPTELSDPSAVEAEATDWDIPESTEADLSIPQSRLVRPDNEGLIPGRR